MNLTIAIAVLMAFSACGYCEGGAQDSYAKSAFNYDNKLNIEYSLLSNHPITQSTAIHGTIDKETKTATIDITTIKGDKYQLVYSIGSPAY